MCPGAGVSFPPKQLYLRAPGWNWTPGNNGRTALSRLCSCSWSRASSQWAPVPQSPSGERLRHLLPSTLQTAVFQTQSREPGLTLLQRSLGTFCVALPSRYSCSACFLHPTMKTHYRSLFLRILACVCLPHAFLGFQEFQVLIPFPGRLFHPPLCSELHGWLPSIDFPCSSVKSRNVRGELTHGDPICAAWGGLHVPIQPM